MKRACLAVISVLMAVACGGDESVPTTPTVNAFSFAIQGPPPTVGPGQMAQLKAVARSTDGSERDVTAEARWMPSPVVVVAVVTVVWPTATTSTAGSRRRAPSSPSAPTVPLTNKATSEPGTRSRRRGRCRRG